MPQHGGRKHSMHNSHEQDVQQHRLHGVVADEAPHALVVHYEGVHANEQDEPAAAAAAVQVSGAATAALLAERMAEAHQQAAWLVS
jgi:hypothetical protein